MKYFVVIICLGALIVFLSGCEKNVAIEESTLEESTDSSFIIGTWELRLAQSGMVPTIEYAAGNGNILKFSGSFYEKYLNGNLIKSGHYNVVKDTSVMDVVGLIIPAGQFTNRIIFDSDFSSRKTFIEVSNNKLTFLSGFFPTDGGSRLVYERKEGNL